MSVATFKAVAIALEDSYGTAAGSVLVYQVVLPTGQFVTASETSYPDLFWEPCGESGDTYGIVTSAIVKAHPNTDVTLSKFTLRVVQKGIRLCPRRTSGKVFANTGNCSLHIPTQVSTLSYFILNIDGQVKLWEPVLSAVGHAKRLSQNVSTLLMDTTKQFGIPLQTLWNTRNYESYTTKLLVSDYILNWALDIAS